MAQKIVVNLGICSVVKGKNIFLRLQSLWYPKELRLTSFAFFFHIDDGKQKLVVLLNFCFYQD